MYLGILHDAVIWMSRTKDRVAATPGKMYHIRVFGVVHVGGASSGFGIVLGT